MTKPKIQFLILLGWLFILAPDLARGQALETSVIHPRAVEARVFYPFVKFKDKTFRSTQKNFLGMGLLYQYFVFSYFGLFFEPSISAIPVAQAGSKSKLANVGLNAGLVIRPFPNNWFNPQVFLMSGVAGQDAGDLTTLDLSSPLGSRLEVSLYSDRSPYQDSTLALVASGQLQYYISQISVLEPTVFDIGIGLRGSF